MPNDIQLSIEFGVKILEDIVAAGYDFLVKEKQKRDLFGRATERYVKGLIERFGEVKVLGMNRPVPLLSLYVRANILEKITARMGAKPEELEEFFDFDRRNFGKTRETKDGEAIANELPRFIVLGKPGAGKTTFLKYLALAMVHQQSTIQTRRLPIFVTLRDWADKKCSLMEYIVDQFDICGFEQATLFVENALKQGNCLVLLDGLDEVSQEANLDGIIRDIRDFTDKYSDNQFVLSCRVAAYNHWFERFTDVEMADFNEEQVTAFVKNWFRKEVKTAEACLSQLKENPHLKELSKVPLLLTMLCITYDENNDFPTNRAELYKDAVEVLLRKWDSSRRIRRDDPYRQLSVMQKENMFARIAFGTFSENRYFIREQELTQMISNFLGNLPAFKAENLEVDSAEVLRTIEAHHGIFVERAKHIHTFAHLTFQEYFTAKYILDNLQGLAFTEIIKRHLYDFKWREVFLLVAGMLSDADELLLSTLRKNRELLADPIINKLIASCNIALLPTNASLSLPVRKALILYLLIVHMYNASTKNTEKVRVLDRKYARALKQVNRLEQEIELALERERSREIIQARNPTTETIKEIGKERKRDQTLIRNAYQKLAAEREIEKRLYAEVTDATFIQIFIGRARDQARLLVHYFDQSYILDSENEMEIDPKLYHEISLIEKQMPVIKTVSTAERLFLFIAGSLLITQCLNSATYLSKSTREYVLENLLVPLEEGE